MEFKSLSELVQYVDKAFAAKFYSGASVLRKGVLKIIASVIGGALYMMMLLAKRIWKNRFVSTCGVEALDGFGSEYGLPHKAPLFAFGSVQVSLSDGSTSATVPAGTYFVDSVTGLEYKSVVATSISSSSLTVKVIADVAGSDYNAAYGTELKFRDSTPTGLEDEVSVVSASGLHNGYSCDVVVDGVTEKWGETAEEYRARLLERIQNPAHGGSLEDYKLWATRFDYVTNAFVKSGDPKANAVCVAVGNFSASNMKLTSDQLSEVTNYVTSDVRRPITADVRVFNITPVVVTFRVAFTPYNDAVLDSLHDAIVKIASKVGPGESMNADEIKIYLLANSQVESITSMTVQKSGSAAGGIELAFDGSSSLAEVVNAKMILTNGES